MDNIVETEILSLVDEFINTMIEMQNSGPDKEQKLYESAEQQLLALADKALFLLGGREEYLEAMLHQLITQKLPQGPVMDSFGDFKEDISQVVSKSMDIFWEKKNNSPEAAGSQPAEIVEEKAESVSLPSEDSGEQPDSGLEASVVESEPGEAGEQAAGAEKEDGEAGEQAAGTEKEDGEAGEQAAGTEGADGEESPEGEDFGEDRLGLLVKMAFPGEEFIKNQEFADITLEYYLPKHNLAIVNASNGMAAVSNIAELALRKSGITVIRVDPSRAYNLRAFKREVMRTLSRKNFEEKRVFDLFAE